MGINTALRPPLVWVGESVAEREYEDPAPVDVLPVNPVVPPTSPDVLPLALAFASAPVEKLDDVLRVVVVVYCAVAVARALGNPAVTERSAKVIVVGRVHVTAAERVPYVVNDAPNESAVESR